MIRLGATASSSQPHHVQCGTDLNMVRLADEAERWLGKPVLAINAVIWWMALRDNDIRDQLHGFGSLLREF